MLVPFAIGLRVSQTQIVLFGLLHLIL